MIAYAGFMARLIIFALAVGVTLYALLDWAFYSKKFTPGGISRWIWLAVIILIPVLGPITWIVLHLVSDAETKQEHEKQIPPDDDLNFLSDVSHRIKRRRGSKDQ